MDKCWYTILFVKIAKIIKLGLKFWRLKNEDNNAQDCSCDEHFDHKMLVTRTISDFDRQERICII